MVLLAELVAAVSIELSSCVFIDEAPFSYVCSDLQQAYSTGMSKPMSIESRRLDQRFVQVSGYGNELARSV